MKEIRLALLTSMLTNPIGREILFGIKDSIKDKNISLFTFTGGSLYKEYNEWIDITSNSIYELPSKKRFDGIIMYGGSIGQYVSPGDMAKFCEAFKDIPIVNISYELPSVPTVSVANYTGMYRVVDHLIKEHNLKNIAFIKGPEDHIEAIERFNGFKKALSDNRMVINDKYIVKGDFSTISGENGVKTILDERGLEADAFVCIDDDTAFGAIKELNKRGIKIPEDIAVVGFDDSDIAGSIRPALTTVRQPFHELGQKAVETLLKILKKEKVDDLVLVDSKAVIRDSCGCIQLISRFRAGKYTELKTDLSKGTKSIVYLLKNKFSSKLKLDDQTLDSVINSFYTTLNNPEDNSFFRVFNSFLMEQDNLGNDFEDINEFLNFFRALMIRDADDKKLEIVKIVEEARIRNCIGLHKLDVIKRIGVEKRYFALNQVNQILHQAMSLKDLFDETFKYFKTLKVESCYIVLFNDLRDRTKGGKLVFGYDHNGRIDISEGGLDIEPGDILPDDYYKLRNNNRIALSLSFNNESMGYMIIEVENDTVDLTPAICWHYSSTIKRIFILQEKELKAIELNNTLKVLKDTQKKLIESEKIAHLGNMVSGVAHEINTPLGVGMTYISLVEDKVNGIIKDIERDNLKRSFLIESLEAIKEASTMSMKNLKNTSKLVQSFKKVSVISSSSDIKDFFLSDAISDFTLIFKNTLKKQGHTIKSDCPKDIHMHSDPGAIFQVLTGLVDNSVHHGFAGDFKGKIYIHVTLVGDKVQISFYDNGVGINPEDREKIFEPFYTTKRNRGFVGLGLNTTYNLVVQLLKGTIDISKETDGTCFIISIPLTIT